ncbi:hypothetical protein [Streptomonospora wellingtoniae]|uniref:Uncharacterized protein n=1 Tax=Streptomonospora wellingtoniae TaxID=3075544 RepID=A0ABU2KZ91_9ACTN|nr:hypothetical protein [Streptomonospora sp. DSM 45055]MDT0304393.1 hypothetical protein [Streptomonospora sp. DSM 45055]
MSDLIPGATTPEVPPPTRCDRTRPYVYEAPVPPDYVRFCEVHTRHRELWRLTYAPGQQAPYVAHHRRCDSVALAATDLDALDFALARFVPPPRPRPYVGDLGGPGGPSGPGAPARSARLALPARVVGPADARCLHEMADDLAAGAHEHAYWTSAVRDASLEILARVARLLGETCGLPAPAAAPAPVSAPAHDPGRTDRSACLRPSAHDGCHLDGSGLIWGDAEEGDR